MIVPEGARNIEFVGHTDQGGRGDGVQVMVCARPRIRRYTGEPRHHGHRRARPAQSEAGELRGDASEFGVSMHLQTADDLLLRIQEADQRALLSQQEYYGGSGKVDSSRFGKRGEDYAAGMSVYDITDPANPRSIGFLEVRGPRHCIASGGSAAAMPMPRHCSTGSPTTS